MRDSSSDIKGHILKTELQSLGVRMEQEPANARLGGAGPAEGIVISFGRHQASVPLKSDFVSNSPFHIQSENGCRFLFRKGKKVIPVNIPEKPSEYDLVLSDGVKLSEVALLHGHDCLGSTVVQSCRNQDGGRGCAFCGINLSLKNGRAILRKEPSQLAEAARALKARHAVLTTGAWSDDESVVDHLIKCSKALSEEGLKVQVQLCPPDDLGLLAGLKEAGAEAVALNIESPDMDVIKRYAPAKAETGIDGYRESWKEAARIFGKNGIISFILAGLGESDESIFHLVEELCGLGVYPFLVPFRPIPGTPLEENPPPDADRMRKLYEKTAKAVIESGMSWREVPAGCGRCDACSCLADFEDALLVDSGELYCSPAIRPDEIARCMEIRRRVFVEEQKIFKGTDEDEYDRAASHIFCGRGEEIVGTVRVHRNEDGNYRGSRLCVLPEHRGGAGRALVRAAEEYAGKRGGQEVRGLVQAEQTGFFKKLGWREDGQESNHFGRPHHLMISDKI